MQLRGGQTSHNLSREFRIFGTKDTIQKGINSALKHIDFCKMRVMASQATGIVPIGGPAVSVPTGMFLLMQP